MTLYNDIVMLTEAVKAPYLKALEPRPIKPLKSQLTNGICLQDELSGLKIQVL